MQPEQNKSVRSDIVIQLTDTKGEWDRFDDSDLPVTTERINQKFQKSKPSSNDIQTDKHTEWDFHSSVFHVPLSPSSPGSLGDCSSSSLAFLSPSHQPLSNLVKSLSTELELRDASSLKPRPLINLVKSISTELSRSSPEVSQSKSDSKLSVHLWSQLTQSKRHNGDSRTAPSSPVRLSPTRARTGFFKVELEDTCRKLTEAMHEPLSVFSKIIREDSMDRLKHQKSTDSIDSFYSKGLDRSSGEPSVSESPMRSCKKLQCEEQAISNQPARPYQKCIHCISCDSHSLLSKVEDKETSELCTCDQSVHNINATNKCDLVAEHVSEQPSSPVPGMGLSFVAVLSYCYFISPISPYWSGMFIGLAFGFMLGLLLIQLGLTSHTHSGPKDEFNKKSTHDLIQGDRKNKTLKGWINVMYTYDPETSHPSLMHSVYARLEGPCLRLAYPFGNIPCWATFNEPFYDEGFSHSCMFHLDGSKVFLLPPTLAQKRVWNRKYPICITVAKAEEPAEEVVDQPDPHFIEKSALSHSKANHNINLYIFTRTGREKEEWFNHLCAASLYRNEGQNEPGMAVLHEEQSSSSVPAIGSLENMDPMPIYDFNTYMIDLISSGQGSSSPCSHLNSKQGSLPEKDKNECQHGEQTQSDWVNALIGRIFWDFLCKKYWFDQVAHKIQRKLSKIRLPYFMDELTLTELSMGSCMPQITGLFQPQVDARGLWLRLNIKYTGSLQMTLETKINLSKLGKEEAPKDVNKMRTKHVSMRSKLAVLADSDEESSSAGTSDEEDIRSTELQESQRERSTIPGAKSGLTGGNTGRQILRLVDKLAKSKYFQKAAENEYIKKKIEVMSNTPLLLTVEVKELSGELAVNIPPPPTDRIWYSFCVPPKLDLRVQPKLGEREVTICHVAEWIEKKLQDEFQKVFVLPNMDDIYLPLMHSALDGQPAHQHSQPLYPFLSSALDSSDSSVLNHSLPME